MRYPSLSVVLAIFAMASAASGARGQTPNVTAATAYLQQASDRAADE